MMRHSRVARQRADHEPTAGSGLYLPEGKSVDVNHLIRPLHIELHEIDQRCAACYEANICELLGCFRPGSGLHGLVDGGRLLVLEGLHPFLLRTANELKLVWNQAWRRTACTAAMMLGYAPQRQIFPYMACLTSSSVGPTVQRAQPQPT